MELKEKLVALRKEKGLTQLVVAEKLNVSRQAISRWESGTAQPSTILDAWERCMRFPLITWLTRKQNGLFQRMIVDKMKTNRSIKGF